MNVRISSIADIVADRGRPDMPADIAQHIERPSFATGLPAAAHHDQVVVQQASQGRVAARGTNDALESRLRAAAEQFRVTAQLKVPAGGED